MSDKLEALKAAALAATPGPWYRSSVTFNGITSEQTFMTQGNKPHIANAGEKRDAIFIAQANPAAVLELLAALEEKDQQAETLKNELLAIDKDHALEQKDDAESRARQLNRAGGRVEKLEQLLRDAVTAAPAPAVPAELLDAMAEVIRISDRDHEAWDRAKAAISACQPDGEKCWSCGKYFTYAQHSECDGYCPHCNAPVDLDDEDQPSQVVPVEPTEDMVSKAWREALGKCDHETIKRMYAIMLAAAPTPTK